MTLSFRLKIIYIFLIFFPSCFFHPHLIFSVKRLIITISLLVFYSVNQFHFDEIQYTLKESKALVKVNFIILKECQNELYISMKANILPYVYIIIYVIFSQSSMFIIWDGISFSSVTCFSLFSSSRNHS